MCGLSDSARRVRGEQGQDAGQTGNMEHFPYDEDDTLHAQWRRVRARLQEIEDELGQLIALMNALSILLEEGDRDGPE